MVCECDCKRIPQSESVPTLTAYPNELELDTEAVVIGNGPAGISISAFLSGWLPFYNKKQGHPDEIVNEHLLEARGKSLIDQAFQMNCQVDEKNAFSTHPPFAFNQGQKATEAAREICQVYGEGSMDIRAAQRWFSKFRSGDFCLDDAPRSGRLSECRKCVFHQLDSSFERPKAMLKSLRDLSWFQDECAERINPGVGPFAAFYDTLVRPPVAEERQFLANGCHISCLEWRHLRHRAVPHIVLGDGEVGGSWNSYDDDMVTVSMAHWMDLPCYPLAAWMGGKPLINRLPAAVIRQYFQAYTKHIGIDYNFKPFSKVTSVMNFCYDQTGERYWQVSGLCRGLPFSIKCRKIVLACGRSHPRTLEVMGELNTTDSRVVYDVASMKRLLSVPSIYVEGPVPISSLWSPETELEDKIAAKQVVVVGDGISAADAVLHCLANSIPVLHLIRRNEKQIRNVMISRLSVAVYPEYAKVFRLMTKRESDPNYRCRTSSQVVSLDNQLRLAAIQTPHGIINEPFNFIVACVGRQSQLEMLSGKFEFLANYQSSEDSTLFAIGSLAGDHFVRYLIGGALQVAQTLIKQNQEILHQYKVAKPLLCHLWSRTFDGIQMNACVDEENMLATKHSPPKKRSDKKYRLKENSKKTATNRPDTPVRTSCELQTET